MAYEPKHLKRWTMPDSYSGAVWPAYYRSGFGRSRDSDTVEESNFAVASKALAALSTEAAPVVVVSEGHWAVGWVEWIAIHQDNEAALRLADELNERYQDYPLLDKMHHSELEWERAGAYWESLPIRDRVELCQRFRCNVFKARHDWIPDDDNGGLFQYLAE